MNRLKKQLLIALSSLSLISQASPLDFVLRGAGGLFIPIDTKLDLNTGFSQTLQIDADIFGFLTAGIDSFFNLSPQTSIGEKAFLYGAGFGLGGYYFPFSRLYLGTGLAGGVYQAKTTANQEQKSTSNLYWRSYLEAGYRFTPELTLSLGSSYSKFLLEENSEKAITIFAGARYSKSIGKGGSSSILTTLDQDTPAFPVFMKAYRNNPLASLKIKNNEGAEIKNVHVSFRAGKYTASTFESTVIPRISKHSTEEISLYADFSKNVLSFVENGKIAGEIILDYEFLGKKLHSVQNAIIPLYNSNAFVWIDTMALSSFISPDTPEILEFAKYVAGIARNSFLTGMNRNLQVAAAMTEALVLSGVSYSKEKLTPYTEFHLSTEVDDIQYPLQTLNMSGGDYDDLGILLASCLESVGVPTGYLPLDDDFIVLVATGLSESGAENNFADTSSLLIDDENVYFGISMKDLGKGFAVARESAADKIKAVLEDENAAVEYTNVQSAWTIYEPCAYSENGAHYEKPVAADITDNLKFAIEDYIDTDLKGVLSRALKSGDSNRIGLVYVKMGRYSDAKTEFMKSSSTKSLNNLANVYMLEKNYNQAASTYRKVLFKDPENAAAKRGLENVSEKLWKK